MTRLLQVIKYADYSGAPRHVFTLLAHAKKQYATHLCVGVTDAGLDQRVPEGVSIHVLDVVGRRAGLVQAMCSVHALYRLIRRERIDLVHAHSPLAGACARVAAALAGVPCVFTAHGWNFAPGLPWRRRAASWILEWLVARLGQPIIAVSDFDAALAARLKVARAPQLRVIANGIADQQIAPPVRSASSLNIVMVARFWEQKRQQDVIRAIVGIPSPLILRLVGDGELLDQCRALVASLGLENQVEFTGCLESVDDILAQADICILASNYEGLPLAVLEAMRAGLPVVASDVGGVSQAVIDGETGFLVPPGDVDGLRQCLRQLIADPSLRQRMGQAGRQRYQQYFTESRMIEQTFSLYDTLLLG